MSKVIIHFKGGSKQEINVKQFEAKINGFGDLTRIEWEAQNKGISPLFIRLNDVSGIFVENEGGSESETNFHI